MAHARERAGREGDRLHLRRRAIRRRSTSSSARARRAAGRSWSPTKPLLAVTPDVFGVLVQYPATDGGVHDYRELAERRTRPTRCSLQRRDLLALTLLAPPGEWGADVVVGNSQRFGVPLGYGGPHAGVLRDAGTSSSGMMPGPHHRRLARRGRQAGAAHGAADARAAHPPREGDEQRLHGAGAARGDRGDVRGLARAGGLTRIAKRVHRLAAALAAGLERAGHAIGHDVFFDTVRVEPTGRPRSRSSRRPATRASTCVRTATRCASRSTRRSRPVDVADVLAAFGAARCQRGGARGRDG